MFGTKSSPVLAAEIPTAPEVPATGARSTMRDVVAAALASATVQYMRAQADLRASEDIESIHKARVAVRKFRSYLHVFLPVLDEPWARRLREQMRALQDALAPARDADVFAQRLEELRCSLTTADAAGAAEVVDAARREAHAQWNTLREALHRDECLHAINAMIDASRLPQMCGPETIAAADAMPRVMNRALKTVRKAVREGGDAPDDRALHRIRIKSKHLRYAAEAYACVCGSDASHYAHCVERLQEILGEQHDAVVAAERLRRLELSPAGRFVAGELAMAGAERGRKAATGWHRAWHNVCRKKTRFW